MKTKLTNTDSTFQSTTKPTNFVRAGVLASSLLASLMIASPASAASPCKGLDNSACSTNASCGWVDSYQRKDGRAVKAFCRTKSGAKRSSAKKAQASSSAPNSAPKKLQKTVAKNGG